MEHNEWREAISGSERIRKESRQLIADRHETHSNPLALHLSNTCSPADTTFTWICVPSHKLKMTTVTARAMRKGKWDPDTHVSRKLGRCFEKGWVNSNVYPLSSPISLFRSLSFRSHRTLPQFSFYPFSNDCLLTHDNHNRKSLA